MTTADNEIKMWREVLAKVKGDEQKAQFIRESLRDKANLHIFGKYFFPQIIRGSIPDCHLDLIAELSRRQDSAIIFPRGHAKSTWEKIDTLHDIVYRLEPVILYVGNTIGDAQIHFEAIKAELESNTKLRQVYGVLVPPEWQDSPKWTNKHFETTNGVNVVARGAAGRKGRGVNIKNQRPTKIILDDVEDDEQVSTQEQRDKLARWLYKTIIPSLDKDVGFVKFIGTVINDACEVLKFYKANGGIFRKAIENGESIWWSMDKLMALKTKIGSVAFAQEYLNEPVNDETALVKLGWLKFYNRGEEPADLTKYAYADLAISTSDKADYFVILVVGVDNSGNVWILDLIRVRGLTFNGQVEAIIQCHLKHKLTRIGIESVAYQRALEQEVKRQGNLMKPPVYVPAVPVVPDGDKQRGVLRISPQIENGTIHFLREHTILVDELTRFPNAEHDDTVDTLTGVMRIAGTRSEGKVFILEEEDF